VNGSWKRWRRHSRQAVALLRPGGRLAVIAFHSLEDRIVKQFFQRESRDCLCPPEIPVCACGHRATMDVVTRKPIRPTATEVDANPRSRSARLEGGGEETSSVTPGWIWLSGA
jgi:16S rRNA (cytosine1402-N4)-methyltransferase